MSQDKQANDLAATDLRKQLPSKASAAVSFAHCIRIGSIEIDQQPAISVAIQDAANGDTWYFKIDHAYELAGRIFKELVVHGVPVAKEVMAVLDADADKRRRG